MVKSLNNSQKTAMKLLSWILKKKKTFINYCKINIPLIPQTPALYISILIKTSLHKLQLQMAHTNKSKVNKKESGGKK